MPLQVPPTNPDGSLRYYTEAELAQIDIKRRGVGGEGTHVEENFGPDGSGATRLYSCEWAERFAAVLVMVGYAKSYTDGDGKDRISRLLPDCHPGLLNLNWIATKCRTSPYRFTGTIDPVDFGQTMPRFTRALLEVNYELFSAPLLDDDELAADQEYQRYIVEPGHPGADITVQSSYIQMPGGIQNFTSANGTDRPAGLPVPYSIGVPESTSTKKFIWKRVPRDLYGEGTTLYNRIHGDGITRGYIGSLNKTTFFGHPPLTLKLENVEERLLPDPLGLGYAWDIVFVFSHKPTPYGHLGLLFFETTVGGGAATSGYYQVTGLTNAQTRTAAELAAAGDSVAMFHIREHADLLIVGAV
jgi:hypothetical protein